MLKTKVLLMIFSILCGFNLAISQSKSNKDVSSQAINILESALKDKGITEIKNYIKLAKAGKGELLNKKFASRDQVRNPNDSNDLAEYAKIADIEATPELTKERIDFFKTLDKNCGKMKKVYVGSMENEGEPLGFAFRLTIPGKKKKGEAGCTHYTVSFRNSLDGELLITEWYDMPGNYDCQ